MDKLNNSIPCLIGATLNVVRSATTPIFISLCTENSKDVAIFLLNLGIDGNYLNMPIGAMSHLKPWLLL